MEKLFYKINKYSYKLGNSIESNDIQKIDIYTKHHIHHFEQCGKAIIQSGGNMAEFTEMLGEYIDNVNALVDTYTTKLEELSSLNQQKVELDEKVRDIFDKQDPLKIEAEAKKATIIELQAELELLKTRRVSSSSVGGSIKNNNKINGAKHDIHYIQQYGKAIIQSGGTIKELKKSLEGYIVDVAQFLDKYSRMMQEHDAVTNAVKKSNANVLEVKATLDELSVSNATAQQEIDALQSQIEILQSQMEKVVLEEEEELASTNVAIKSLVDKVCDEQMDKAGKCHKNIQHIDSVLESIGFHSPSTYKLGQKPIHIFYITFYKTIKENDINKFKIILKSDKKYNGITFLQLIGLVNIRIILKRANVQVIIDDVSMDASDERFKNAKLLLTNNDNAIDAIASFFYEELLIPNTI